MKLEKTSISKTYKKVRCIDNTYNSVELTFGEIYHVRKEDETWYWVECNIGLGLFLRSRFEDVTEKKEETIEEKELMCIENCYNPEIITIGKKYKVLGKDDKGYYIKNDNYITSYLAKENFSEINEEKEFEEVLKLEYMEVWDRVAFKIVYQDEEIFKRGVFQDNELQTRSIHYPDSSENSPLLLRGTEIEKDEMVKLITKKRAEKIKEIVLKLNLKYGKIKTDEEIIASYPIKAFEKGAYNYILIIQDNKNYDFTFYTGCQTLGTKYYTEESVTKMVAELNNKRRKQ